MLFVVTRFHRLETSWFVKLRDDLKIAKQINIASYSFCKTLSCLDRLPGSSVMTDGLLLSWRLLLLQRTDVGGVARGRGCESLALDNRASEDLGVDQTEK